MAVTRRRAHGAMLLYSALISGSFVVGDRITAHLDPLVLTLERFALAALAFAFVARGHAGFWPPTRPMVARGAVLGAVMTTYFVLMFVALRSTDSVTTGALFTLLPLLSAVVARFLVEQRTRAAQWAMMALGASSAAFVVTDGDVERLLALDLGAGAGVFVLGTCAFAFYSPLVRKLHVVKDADGERALDLVALTFWTLSMSAVLLVVIAGARAVATDWSAVPARVHLGVLYLGVVNTAVTFFLAKTASTVLPASKTMAYTYLTPVFVVALEVALGRGLPSVSLLLGLVVTASATALFLRSRES